MWVVVFVCFAVKGVHIDFVNDCTTHAFLNAFRRFVGQCRLPSHLYSDNATTFKGANRELQSYIKLVQADPEVQAFFANEQIAWHFLPPNASHFEGLWEAEVKSVEKHLKPLLHSEK